MTDTDIVLLPTARSLLNLFLSKVYCIHEISMTSDLSNIVELINNQKFDKAEELVKKLKSELPNTKLIESVAILARQILDKNAFKKLSQFSEFVTNMYQLNKLNIMHFYNAMDLETATKLMELAKKTGNLTGVTFHIIKTILNFFKTQGDWEPPISKKMREDLEYVELIKMYLNGSKDLPERKTDNFNYALLSEFLKKDDLRVLKSIEDYLDSAETKALGAAGSVAQSIEKEDLEPGVKKVKKDIERIEKLED